MSVPGGQREGGFQALLGVEVLECSAEHVRGRLPVTDGVRQPAGLLHGGVLAAIAESLTLAATAEAVSAADGVVPISNSTSFLRPFTQGSVHADGISVHRGRSTWVWEVRFSDDEGRLGGLSRMTVGLR